MMKIQPLATLIGTLGVIIGGFLAVDNRYFLAVRAAEMRDAIKADQKQTATELRIEIYRTRLSLLNSKSMLTKDEQEELAFTRKLVEKLQTEALSK